MRQTINKGKASYHPNTLGEGCPSQAGRKDGYFTSYPERIDVHKIRGEVKSFFDYFSNARLFFNSQSPAERNHLIDAFSFELGKIQTIAVCDHCCNISIVGRSLQGHRRQGVVNVILLLQELEQVIAPAEGSVY